MHIEIDRVIMDDELKTRFSERRESEEYYKGVITDVEPIAVEGKKTSEYSCSSYQLKEKQYYFSTFRNVEIGEPVALGEEEYLTICGKSIRYCVFENCKFQNVKFVSCNFAGCVFINCTLYPVVFENCYFSMPYIKPDGAGGIETFNIFTEFQKCFFSGRFEKCNLEYGYLHKCATSLTKFYDCNIHGIYIDTCALHSSELKDCDLISAKIYHTDILEITFVDDKGTKIDEETFFDYKLHSKKPKAGGEVTTEAGWKKPSYEAMAQEKAKTLRQVSKLFERNGYSDHAGEYFYRSKCMDRLGSCGIKKMTYSLSWLICGYGERPIFTFLSMIAVMLIFAFAYVITGFSIGQSTINLDTLKETWPNIWQILKCYGHSTFFSITTFSTVGYGNYVPVGEWSSIFAAIEMLAGVSLSALWTGCFFRKIVR